MVRAKERRERRISPKERFREILRERESISEEDSFGIIWEACTFLTPEQMVALRRALKYSRDPDEITEAVFPEHREKVRKKRQDSISLAYWSRERKHKGRPRAKESDYLKEAFSIVSEQNLRKWETDFGIDRRKYMVLRDEILDAAYGDYEPNLNGFDDKVIRRMDDELYALSRVMHLFTAEIDKAKEKGNTFFLNVIRSVFKKEARFYVEGSKGPGDNIRDETLRRRWKHWQDYYLKGKKAKNVSKNFYTQEKLIGLCFLACLIHWIFKGPALREMDELRRELAIIKIDLLMERFGISVKSLSASTSTPSTPLSRAIALHTEKDPLKRQQLERQWEDRQRRIDQLLNNLTNTEGGIFP